MADSISADTLADLQPLQELGEQARRSLASKATVATLKAGTRITAAEENRWMIYALEGRFTFVASDKPTLIEAGSPRAKQPLFSGQNLRDFAVCATQAQILRIDRNMYESLGQQQREANFEVEETILSPTESALFAKIYQNIVTGRLDLPAMPEVALKIQGAINAPDADAYRLSRIIQMDLAVTGGLVKAANSALYGGASPVGSVRDAIVRLGFDVTRQLVISIAMKQVFRTDVPGLKQRMKALWDRSVHVSALSYVLARHTRRFDPEHAMLAGLLYQVGMVPLLDHIGRRYGDITDTEVDSILTRLHPVVGELVINYWGLGPDICLVVRECGNLDRNGHSTPDYCDVVQVADLYRRAHDRNESDTPRYHQVSAYEKLGLPEPDADMKIDVIREAEEEVREVMDFFKGVAVG
ncbi:HDOD domain-containing protein [Ectothiorhodospira lacustris]|uniref:HDOD domain-containing protein n=1 Tax=Ectothiorhodospira lacustris TaxID=2899127 RepID=UPI001EE7F937|nr:HDOD domain-containing protein [Ectothiorhodospira lacustris]MCG5500872.1 HDOD domain-containing protein [Ectothiorhodospira lacustris]MCG5511394.1 HDOD domain-containing protein [Ectothiorhodospira lacustris]MCG5523205.1 HDOD domain-containing protein [Ectothiorhodospira lacustris]